MEILTHRRRLAPGLIPPLLLLAAGHAAMPGARAQTQWQEDHVEAAFLFNFAKFVEWPAGSNATASAPFTFCALGAARLHVALEDSLAGKNMNGHPLVVRQISRPEDAAGCQVAFIGGDQKKHLPAALDALKGAAVLTVADFELFARRGGMIELIKEGNKFRFAVNLDAVNRHRLRVSSRLLQLAEVIHETSAAGETP